MRVVGRSFDSALKCVLILFHFAVCSVRVIGESDIMQEFLSESDEVSLKSQVSIVSNTTPYAIFIYLFSISLTGS